MFKYNDTRKKDKTINYDLLIPLTLAYDYLIAKGFFKHQLKEDDYHLVYKAIVRGMMASEFIDLGGVSSTSYKFQKKCIDYIKESIDKMLIRIV